MKHIPVVLLGLAAWTAPALGGEPPGALLESLADELRQRGAGQVGKPMPLDENAFGTGTTVTVIPPAAFSPGLGGGGPLYDMTELATLQVLVSGTDPYWAPLDLPNGAVVDRLCLVANESTPAGSVNLFLVATEVDRTPGWAHDPFATLVSTGVPETPGWTRLCASDLDILHQAIADVDGDGQPGVLTYSLLVTFNSDTGSEQELGAVEVAWHRTLSPAPEVATFDDVPTSHLFFQQIEALAASGVTSGCGADSYCPDAPLTRGQMAAFLATALGLHWPN